jgi:hypothetical protein
MPSPLRDPKTLFEWLEMDYYRRPRRLRRFRRWLIWLILLASIAAVALTLWPGKRRIYQAGPLSAAHAMFNDDCTHCHTEAFQTAFRLLPGHTEVHSVSDAACTHCHDGPLHNPQQASSPACATCHQEHRGRMLLADVAPRHCATCHADLKRKDGAPERFPTITDFNKDHPEFELFRGKEPVDPGKLHFNHEYHLRTQGVRAPDGKMKTLTCLDCHKPDATRKHMYPINYEVHCAECHSLGVQVAAPGEDKEAKRAADEFARMPAPHRTPAEVRATLRDRLTQLIGEQKALLDSDGLPDKVRVRPGQPVTRAEDKQNMATWVDFQLKKNEKLLFGTVEIDPMKKNETLLIGGSCVKCHIRKPSKSDPPEFEPPMLTRRWMSRGKFNHDSHRLLTCTECHDAEKSSKTSDVLLPRIDSCRKCHNPQGARSECVNCHRYHDRSKEGDWVGTMTIDKSLGGHAPGKP